MTLSKGIQTKHRILDEALDIASIKSLSQTSIGDVAKATSLSRSGLFAHFKSKEDFQIEILKHAAGKFIEVVIKPCEKIEDPIQKLHMLKKIWPGWYERTEPPISGGCIFFTASAEFDDQKGPTRDYLYSQQKQFIEYIEQIFAEAQRRKQAHSQINKSQFAYEFYSLFKGYQYYKRFFEDTKAKSRFTESADQLISRVTIR